MKRALLAGAVAFPIQFPTFLLSAQSLLFSKIELDLKAPPPPDAQIVPAIFLEQNLFDQELNAPLPTLAAAPLLPQDNTLIDIDFIAPIPLEPKESADAIFLNLWENITQHNEKYTADTPETQRSNPPHRPTHFVEIVLDTSHSMNETLQGRRKIEIANDEVIELLNQLQTESPTNLSQIGLRAFGHESPHLKRDCQDSSRAYPFGAVDLAAIKEAMTTLHPKGMTPIAYSLRAAMTDFPPQAQGFQTIVLLTDGQEQCEKNVCETAKELKQEYPGLVIHVIGLDLTYQASRTMSCLARATGGSLFDINNTYQLAQAIKTTSPLSLMAKVPSSDADQNAVPESPILEPEQAAAASLIIPGVGQMASGSIASGVSAMLVQGLSIGYLEQLQNRYQREARQNFPLPSFQLDLFRYAIGVEWISQSIGAAIRNKNRQKKSSQARPIDIRKAATLSFLWPGLGDLYAGENPEIGLSLMGMSAFFLAKAAFPMGLDFNSSLKGNFKSPHLSFFIHSKNPTASQKSDHDAIQRLSLLSLATMQIGAAVTATTAILNARSKKTINQKTNHESPSPGVVGLLSLALPGAGYFALGQDNPGSAALLFQGATIMTARELHRQYQHSAGIVLPREQFNREGAIYSAYLTYASQSMGAMMAATNPHRSNVLINNSNIAIASSLSLAWPGLGHLYIGRNPGTALFTMGISGFLISRIIYPNGQSRSMVQGKILRHPEFFFPRQKGQEIPINKQHSYQTIKSRSILALAALQGGSLLNILNSPSTADNPKHLASLSLTWNIAINNSGDPAISLTYRY